MQEDWIERQKLLLGVGMEVWVSLSGYVSYGGGKPESLRGNKGRANKVLKAECKLG